MSAFAMVVPRRPISSNAGPNTKYSEAIAHAARGKEPGILQGPLYARIIWFHKHPTAQDVDNIAKRILDSLKDIVYRDDHAITHCLAIRVDARSAYEITDPEPGQADDLSLVRHLDDNEVRDVLYIEIGARTSTKIGFGEVV
jgi:hypothetical protein